MNNSLQHSSFVDELLLAFGSRPDCRVWKNATGTTQVGGRWIAFGLKGSADILGIIRGGKFLAIEAKTGQAVQTKEQKAFEKMVTEFGGVYCLARSVESALVAVFGGPEF